MSDKTRSNHLLNFPVFKEGEEVQELLWDKDTHVETVVLMSKVNTVKG